MFDNAGERERARRGENIIGKVVLCVNNCYNYDDESRRIDYLATEEIPENIEAVRIYSSDKGFSRRREDSVYIHDYINVARSIANNKIRYYCLYHTVTAVLIAGSLSALYGGYLIQGDSIVNVKTLFSLSYGLAIGAMSFQISRQVIGLIARTLFLVFFYTLILCLVSIFIVKFTKDADTNEWLVLGAYLALLVFMLATESIQFCTNKKKFPAFEEEIENREAC